MKEPKATVERDEKKNAKAGISQSCWDCAQDYATVYHLI